MCGIIGLASARPVANWDWLKAGRDAMQHRGPDDAGEWWSDDARVGLGHRRLSIVDLSPAGHQPMVRPEWDLVIAFNGEIYNFPELREELTAAGYAFRSHSDTEVLLAAYHAWGEDCLDRLNGMFAFALLDQRRNRVFLARDRAGEKPLFYHHADGMLRFASELKGLMADLTLDRRINHEALDCYLAMGFVPGDLCILQGFSKLPPGHAMTFDLADGALTIRRYWDLPAAPRDNRAESADLNTLVDRFETLVEDAVGRQMLADVPVGVLLSGGVDSSLITAMAVRRSQNVQTFTIGFPGQGKLDEIPHARLIANHFGTRQTELMAEPTSAELLPRLAAQFDEPMVDSSMFPTYLVSELVRQHCTVALGGDGGDELFGGYEHYSALLRMRERLGRVPSGLRRLVAQGAETLAPVGMRGRNWLQGLDVDLEHGLPLATGFFDPTTRKRLMQGHSGYRTSAEAIMTARIPAEPDLIQRSTRRDFHDYLPEDILVKVDRASMLNSLEVRAPLLDYRLIEFAFAEVPGALKATESSKKILLKALAQRVLPPEFDRQRKQGFSIPLAQWLEAGPFREMFWSVLTDSACLFDRRTVQGLLEGQDKGRSNGDRLFALVQFELWRRAYEVGF